MMSDNGNPEVSGEETNIHDEIIESTTAETKQQDASSEHEAAEKTEPSLEEQLTMANDKYLRLVAEFDNVRKRNAKERMELTKTASLEVIKDLLDVLDDSYRTEELLQKKDVELKALKEGVQLVFNKLRKTLEHKGLTAFNSKGEVFDVELHEAITEIPAPNNKLKGKVVDEVQKGYYLNGKLIRHAKVVVGK